MASPHLSADAESRRPAADHLTLFWFAKRSALWLLTVAAGIGAACFLYAYAADPDEITTGSISTTRGAHATVQTVHQTP